jgi:hypothetical protein
MVNRVAITTARINLGAIVKRAHLNGEYFILEKDGIPVAGIMDAKELEDYLDLRAPTVKQSVTVTSNNINTLGNSELLSRDLPLPDITPADPHDATESYVRASRTDVARRYFIQSASRVVRKETAARLFDLFNQIALLRYEEAENSGFLLLARQDRHPTIVRMERPFDVHDMRGVRKMLHMSSRELCLLCDGRTVYGFAAAGSGDPDTLMIQFRDQGLWELRQRGSVIVQVDARDHKAASISLTEDCFKVEVAGIFGTLGPADLDKLWNLITAAKRQARGTNVLISANAAAEAERLESQNTKLRPVELTPLLMERLTSIDGTVVIDTRGVCHAIGAILDGPVSARGDRTRGGRYNSALMYIDNCPFPSCIVVISQDGMVDLVCKRQETRNEPASITAA